MFNGKPSKLNASFTLPTNLVRKDAIEEFFRMTVLGQKIAHQELDAVCHIKPDELFLKAKV